MTMNSIGKEYLKQGFYFGIVGVSISCLMPWSIYSFICALSSCFLLIIVLDFLVRCLLSLTISERRFLDFEKTLNK